MKKNSFLEGTIIATLSLILIKVLGMLYVIPFYATVGTVGAALYAYAYNIYSLFLEIATAGIPASVSKIINEYHTLGKEEAKVRTFKLSKKILVIISIIAFLILMIFAPFIAKIIIGDMKGGNNISDVAFVLRCVSFALLVFPFLSVSRGLFQGHKVVSVSSYSQIIEQVVRVLIIVIGSYIAIKWLKLGLAPSVGVAVFGAFFGGIASLIYINFKIKKYKKDLSLDTVFKEKDDISNKDIIRKIIKYAIPVIVISIANQIYNNVDMILILRTMNKLGFSSTNTEFIATGISTWATKISVIITSIGLGLSSSLIPNMVEASTLKKYDEMNNNFNQALEIIFFISLPMCVGISILSSYVWNIFYGYNIIGTNILMLAIFSPFFANLYSICNYTLQSINKFKLVYISSISGFVANALLDIPFMYLFHKIGLPAYWGATFATYTGFLLTVIITMYYLKKNYNFNYNKLFISIRKIFIPLLFMIFLILLIKILFTVNYSSRIISILYVGFISIIGGLVYFFISYKIGLFNHIFGEYFFTKIKRKIKKDN